MKVAAVLEHGGPRRGCAACGRGHVFNATSAGNLCAVCYYKHRYDGGVTIYRRLPRPRWRSWLRSEASRITFESMGLALCALAFALFGGGVAGDAVGGILFASAISALRPPVAPPLPPATVRRSITAPRSDLQIGAGRGD